jgi:hypothetical protein
MKHFSRIIQTKLGAGKLVEAVLQLLTLGSAIAQSLGWERFRMPFLDEVPHWRGGSRGCGTGPHLWVSFYPQFGRHGTPGRSSIRSLSRSGLWDPSYLGLDVRALGTVVHRSARYGEHGDAAEIVSSFGRGDTLENCSTSTRREGTSEACEDCLTPSWTGTRLELPYYSLFYDKGAVPHSAGWTEHLERCSQLRLTVRGFGCAVVSAVGLGDA